MRRANGVSTVRSERGSALVIALTLGVMVEVVIAMIITNYSNELHANLASKLGHDRNEIAENLSSLFADPAVCTSFLNSTIRASRPPDATTWADSARWMEPTANLTSLGTISQSLAAIASGTSPAFAIRRWQTLPHVGPMAASGTLLTETYIAQGNWARAGQAARLSYQPWPGPNAPTLLSFERDEGRRAAVTNSAELAQAYRSMTKSGLFIRRLILVEADPSALTVSPQPIAWPGTDIPTLPSTLTSADRREFHIWADFGVASDQRAIQPASGSILDLGGTGPNGGPIVRCTPFHGLRQAVPVSAGSTSVSCTGTNQILAVIGTPSGTLGCRSL